MDLLCIRPCWTMPWRDWQLSRHYFVFKQRHVGWNTSRLCVGTVAWMYPGGRVGGSAHHAALDREWRTIAAMVPVGGNGRNKSSGSVRCLFPISHKYAGVFAGGRFDSRHSQQGT